MKFKSSSAPKESVGQTGFGPKTVVPNQALSLEEIIARFTRGETLSIGRDVSYHESDDDLEKVSHMDLVDREEFVEKLKTTQKEFEKQEKRKATKLQERLRAEALAKIEAEEKAKKGTSPEPAK